MTRSLNQGDARDVRKIEALLGGDDPYLSLKQAAQRSGVPLSTLSDVVRHGRVPALTMPDGRRYVRLSAVQTYASRRDVDAHVRAQQRLVERGLLTAVRSTSPVQRALPRVKRAVVRGRPASETLIEERGRW